MNCPTCKAAMTVLALDGHLGRQVSIDVCQPCHVFWFDGYESLQLTPAAILSLFKLISDAGAASHTGGAPSGACPRCSRPLARRHDQQRQTRFEYLGCPERHGRLITFFNFLREKNFIKPLSPAQIESLKRNLETINCSNCGAPVDLARGASCAHCGSPLSMLDVEQAEALVENLHRASATGGTVDPALPINLLRARSEVSAAFAEFERDASWQQRASDQGLVQAALHAFSNWIRQS
jgi:hypothetical protein